MEHVRDLVATVASGRAILFTGAGFSCDACDVDGKRLPDSKTMIEELWKLCFTGEPDDSTLPDLYDAAMICAPDRLRSYTERRLRVGDGPLPPHLVRWFAAPWRRIYTLNVDDLEVAAQRHELPHRLCPVTEPSGDGDAVEVVHLNGMIGDGPGDLTFSTRQYAARLASGDRAYAQLVDDLVASPFVFAGTTLDEAVLWQHVEKKRAAKERPRSFLVTKALSRARQVLLDHLGITWVPMGTEELADQLPVRSAARSS